MNCKTCGATGFENIGKLNQHKATDCPGKPPEEEPTEKNQQTPEPVVCHSFILTDEENAKLRYLYGSDYETFVTERFEYLLKQLLGEEKEETTIDVSHLPKDTLAGLHRNAELKFEVMGVLDNNNKLHVHDVRYPRRGR